MKSLVLAPLLTLYLSGAPDEVPEPPGRTVSVEEIEGELVCTLVVEDENLERVLEQLCRELGVELQGFEGVQRIALITADLRRAPVERVIEYVLGSVGLRARLRTGSLTVTDDALEGADKETLLRRASVAYFEAHAAHPAHRLGVGGRVNQGRIEEARGNWSAALEHYQNAPKDFPSSPRVADALFNAGRVHGRLSQWGEASNVFRKLINLPTAHEYAATGRTELARCFVHLKEETQALSALDLLEKRYPSETALEAIDRLMIRAEANLGIGEYVECLRFLEKLESSGLNQKDRLQVHALRARSLEGLELLDEAGRAWLIYAKEADDVEHARAIERAVRLALDQEDELGALFGVAQARTPELSKRLAPLARQARERLGLAAPGGHADAEELTFKEKLDLAEEWAASGEPKRAAELLKHLLEERNAFDPDSRVLLALAWSGLLEQTSGYESAIDFLSSERGALETLSHQSRLDIRAAEIFESYERYEEAIDAYEGRY